MNNDAASLQWIEVGRATEAADLEAIIEVLRSRWRRRYEYRIEPSESEDRDFHLMLRHR